MIEIFEIPLKKLNGVVTEKIVIIPFNSRTKGLNNPDFIVHLCDEQGVHKVPISKEQAKEIAKYFFDYFPI